MDIMEVCHNANEAALRDGYDQVIYIDEHGEPSFSRDYPDNNMYDKSDPFTSFIRVYWENGIMKTRVTSK